MTEATMDRAGQMTNTASGTFTGIHVHTGPGGGLASGGPIPAGSSTHYHAARLPELGEVVLAVTRVFDPATVAPLRIDLRAFTAAAPGRGALVTMAGADLTRAPGVIAFASITLLTAGDPADERRPATLERCFVTDAPPTADAASGVADWLRATWETELAFGSWPAIRGSLDAFASPDGGAVADWAHSWLERSEHHVDTAGTNSTFLKVLAAAWLDQPGDADTTTE